ncbi:MAG: trypsin-like peptidase domain-containing protein [Planctomycetales bacterium]|nr:trypsin-like peptidase domain-containing protein [Planctomycetales bacterium]
MLLGAALATGLFDGVGAALAQGPVAERGRSTYEVSDSRPHDSAPASLTPDELANIRVYETANAGVVNITTSTVEVDPLFGVRQLGQGAGSGSIIDKNGHILTNNHVIEDARDIQVTLSNGETYEAELIGADAEYDIAVIKIDAPADRLVPVQMGRSDNLRVGQKAYAVGNPFGLEGTLTTGIISSLNRSIPSRLTGRTMTSMIQTDAAMNPGNSGGPLLDSHARMIGVNVAIASKTGQNTGVGFAIPVNRVKRFLPDLVQRGHVVRADHGIIELAETNRGLRIARTRPNGPAERAGLRGFRVVQTEHRQGPIRYINTRIDRDYADGILAIDDQPVSTVEEFVAVMDKHSPGDSVTITILRDGQRQTVNVVLGEA